MTTSSLHCPCGSGNTYALCCQPFHEGKLPTTALQLMCSRFAAYAKNLPQYIIETTHPANPQYSDHHSLWAEKISEFCLNSQFHQLEILDFKEQDLFATVTFVASLIQGDRNITFTEKSLFEKVNKRWLYRNGQLAEGRAPHLISPTPPRVLPIAYYGNPILTQTGEPVTEITEELLNLIERMVETMDLCDGMGLAAPQIHHSIQLFVMRPLVKTENDGFKLGDVDVVINPKISEIGEETWKAPEGCLSLPGIQLEIERPKTITIEYTNLEGQRISKQCSDWEARILMHETDHINGILFIDRLSKEDRNKLQPYLRRLSKRFIKS